MISIFATVQLTVIHFKYFKQTMFVDLPGLKSKL